MCLRDEIFLHLKSLAFGKGRRQANDILSIIYG